MLERGQRFFKAGADGWNIFGALLMLFCMLFQSKPSCEGNN